MDLGWRLWAGLKSYFRKDALCITLWLNTFIGYVIAYLAQILLVLYADGAVYSAVIMSTNFPIAAIFWSLFQSNGFTVTWHPVFSIYTAFSLAGIALLVPSVAAYEYITWKETRDEYIFQRLRQL